MFFIHGHCHGPCIAGRPARPRSIAVFVRYGLTICAALTGAIAAGADNAGLAPANPITVIAHRGASGYLPEHTQEAKVLAFAQGADIIENDLILTRDDVPIVLHDVQLESVTNVAEVFPGRARQDGRYYAVDFDWAEIQQLNVTERLDPKTGQVALPGRFPVHHGRFRVISLEEDLQLMQGLKASTGRTVAVYAEIKRPKFHFEQGKDVCAAVVKVLTQYGLTEPEDPVIIQCFEAQGLKQIRHDLKSRLRISQLLDAEPWMDGDDAELARNLDDVASYANGVSLSLKAVFGAKNNSRTPQTSRMVEAAHQRGLFVHAWTFRVDGVPRPFQSFEEVTAAALRVGVDGMITDFPDRTRAALLDLAP